MYSFIISFLLSFVPFLLLSFMAIEILLRYPKNSLHQLTMILIFTVALIFLSDFMTQTLDYSIVQFVSPITVYTFSFATLTLLVYFFAILSPIEFPKWLLHPMAVVPLAGIFLMQFDPDQFGIRIIEGSYWRSELHSPKFDTLFFIIVGYSLTWLLLIMFMGYWKLKRTRIYQREQRMMLTIIRGSVIAAVWLVCSFAIMNLFGSIPVIPLDSLPTYAGLILTFTLRIAMNKHEFLAGAEQRYKLLFTLSSSGIALVNSAGMAVEVNPAFRQLAGVPDSVKHVDLLHLLADDEKEYYRLLFRKAFEKRQGVQQLQINITNYQQIKRVIEINSEFLEIEGEVYSYMLVRDITQEQKDEARLLELAYTDSLTGLANRYQFNLKLQEALDRSQKYNTEVVVMQLDLDHFKWINDTMGHSAGDLLLINVARLIRTHVPECSVVARMGGDEFAILIELKQENSEHTAITIASGILHGFKKQMILREKYYHVSCSIGVCTAPLDGTDPEILLRNADTAMYAAKQLGRNRYHLFNEQLKSSADRHLMLQQGLELALQKKEFSLVYQPQVDSLNGRVIGMEALLRWNSAELGFVSPVEFIPIAEQNGMIRQIGEWVMEEAVKQAVYWNQTGFEELQVSVNVASSQLSDPHFAFKVKLLLEKTGLPPHLLCLEFTESAAIREDEQIIELCNEMVAMGVSLAVDDFGTGYSSMRTVTTFPFHFIKIDRSLIFDIDRNPRNEAVVRSVLELAEQLNMFVLAEGVETQQHVEMLQQLGCHYIQGYYYGRPMKVEEFEQWMFNRLEKEAL